MDVTRYAIENKVVTLVALAAVLFAGMQAYLNLPRAEDPGFEIRVARVITPFPGASPQRVEQLVTDKLEQRIQEIPEVDNIVSTSRTKKCRCSRGISFAFHPAAPCAAPGVSPPRSGMFP